MLIIIVPCVPCLLASHQVRPITTEENYIWGLFEAVVAARAGAVGGWKLDEIGDYNIMVRLYIGPRLCKLWLLQAPVNIEGERMTNISWAVLCAKTLGSASKQVGQIVGVDGTKHLVWGESVKYAVRQLG